MSKLRKLIETELEYYKEQGFNEAKHIDIERQGMAKSTYGDGYVKGYLAAMKNIHKELDEDK